MISDPLYHLALATDWEAADDSYRVSTAGRSLEDVGFVHCSTAEQVQRTADVFYRGRSDVLLLEIDPRRLGVPVRFEPAPDGEQFPHVYGPLPRAAVISVTKVDLGQDGRLQLGWLAANR